MDGIYGPKLGLWVPLGLPWTCSTLCQNGLLKVILRLWTVLRSDEKQEWLGVLIRQGIFSLSIFRPITSSPVGKLIYIAKIINWCWDLTKTTKQTNRWNAKTKWGRSPPKTGYNPLSKPIPTPLNQIKQKQTKRQKTHAARVTPYLVPVSYRITSRSFSISSLIWALCTARDVEIILCADQKSRHRLIGFK